jgi:protoporphyrinogen oxidase
MRIAVLGAGVSGLAAARKLYDAGVDVTVYEAGAKAGGLAQSRVTNGYVYDPHGGHIFNSKNRQVIDWVFSILPKEHWKHTLRNAKIFFDGRYVSYPFEFSLCELSVEDAVNCVYDFIIAQQGSEPDNFADWLVWNFGAGIANAYMLPYNRKIWAYPLEQMDVSWLRGKMPLPEKKEILRALVCKDPIERKMPHSTFYYPIEGGIQTMINAIAESLDIRLNQAVQSIERDRSVWRVNGDRYNIVISTIPLKILPGVMKLPGCIHEIIGDLKYNSLTTVLVDCPPTDISWLYIPDVKYQAHRIGYQSALTPKAVPNGGGSGAFEIIGNRFHVDSDLPKTALPPDLKAGSIIDTEFTEYAYVIHDLAYPKNVSTIREYFNGEDGFFITGRWGQWNYNNMDMCMADSFAIVDNILKGCGTC